MNNVTKSDFDDIPLDGFRRDTYSEEKVLKKSDYKKEPKGFLPSHTPIPFWLDVVLFFMWCGAVGLSIMAAFFMANLLLGVTMFAGAGALLLVIRTAIKRFLLSRE
ncbi:hypothetical protein [Hirschia litorea]|uniref:Uncharacterized protein n=1 Tax=Hirschia litorea TaxID=1199156 RepID=A0ABW2IJE3_9PROT